MPYDLIPRPRQGWCAWRTKNATTPPATPSADALADELLKMGSFADASTDPGAPPTPDLAELEALLKQASFDTPTPVASSRAATTADEDLADRLMAEARGGPRAAALPPTSQFDLPAFRKGDRRRPRPPASICSATST